MQPEHRTEDPRGGPSVPSIAQPPPGEERAAPPVPTERERIERTLFGSLWVGLIIGAILLILLIVFIVENLGSVSIELIFGKARTPLAIGLLLSAVIGALLVAVPGTIRILQLRRELKRRMR